MRTVVSYIPRRLLLKIRAPNTQKEPNRIRHFYSDYTFECLSSKITLKKKSTLLFFAFERAELEKTVFSSSGFKLSPRRDFEQSRIVLAQRRAQPSVTVFWSFFLQHSDAPRKSRAPLDARAETRTAFFELWR